MITDLFPYAGASFFDERAHRPVHRAATDVIDEILQDFLAAGRMHDFGMELQAVKFSFRILHGCEIATFSRSRDAKPFRQCCYFIAMAVPNIELVA